MAAQPLHPFVFKLGRIGDRVMLTAPLRWGDLPRYERADQIPVAAVFDAWRGLGQRPSQAAAQADFELPPAPLSTQTTSVTIDPSGFSSSDR